MKWPRLSCHSALSIPIMAFFSYALIACVAPGTQGTRNSAGGTVGAAWTTWGKCEAVASWLKTFKAEYPGVDLTYASSKVRELTPRATNLFRDRYFVPAFGAPYESLNPEAKAKIHAEPIRACWGLGSQFGSQFHDSVAAYRWILDVAFPQYTTAPEYQTGANEIAARVRQLHSLEQWMEATLKSTRELPLSDQSLAAVQSRLAEGTEKLAALWPSEHAKFRSIMTQSKANMAHALQARLVQEVGAMQPSLGNAHRIKELLANSPHYWEMTTDGRLNDPRDGFTNRLGEMIAKLVEERGMILKGIPETQSGLKQSAEWYTAFQQNFGAFREMPVVVEANRIFAARRNEMFLKTKSEFLNTLNSFDVSLESVAKIDALMASTFPLPGDTSLPVHADYEKAVWAKKKELSAALLGGSVH